MTTSPCSISVVTIGVVGIYSSPDWTAGLPTVLTSVGTKGYDEVDAEGVVAVKVVGSYFTDSVFTIGGSFKWFES